MGIFEYVKNNNIQQPIKLEIGLHKTTSNGMGRESRYLKVFINRADVTIMIANELNLRLSKAKDTPNCLIVHGGGMDMGFSIQNAMYKKACQQGYLYMFDEGEYIYLGKPI